MYGFGEQLFADSPVELRHILSVDSKPLELREKLAAEYHARWEAVETFKAQELTSMTDERAWEIIHALRLFAPAPPDPMNGMGLVEQQTIFHRRK